MATSLNALAANEHMADLRRAADARGVRRAGLRPSRRRSRRTATLGSPEAAAEVRFAHAEEAARLRHLAELDDAPELAGEILVATIDADVVAALSLEDRRVVANPFVFTSGAVELLRHTATELTGRRQPRRRWPVRLRPRLA